MNDAHHVRTAEQPCDHGRPRAVGIKDRHSGQNQRHGGQQNGQMGNPPDDGEALEIRLGLIRQPIDVEFHALAARLALLVRPVEPQRGMGPEEGKHAYQKRGHELRGEPHQGVAFEVVGIAVRLEGHKPRARVGMAFPTRVKPIGRIHGRTWVAGPLDRMASMAVETLRRIGVAQGVDLSVIGRQVGLQPILMARAAILGNDQLGRAQDWVFDVMTGVAVRADRCLGIMFLQHLPAMDRRCVGCELRGMACAAGVGKVQPPLCPDGSPWGIDVVGIMTIIAGRIGARLIRLRRLRMNRIHELVDLRSPRRPMSRIVASFLPSEPLPMSFRGS